jgi:hypothetical protein
MNLPPIATAVPRPVADGAQMQDWALKHPQLAAKVKPGQAGYEAIREALAELPASARPAPPPPVPASAPSDAQYQTWALANERLARNVSPGQAGYEAIQAALEILDALRAPVVPQPVVPPATEAPSAD